MGGGALDSSVTLEDIVAVVSTKRVALAPELAGFLVLEIAERADPASGDVDTQSVLVGDEGNVALPRSKRGPTAGDAEASIRAALVRLLEASGAQTPALAAAGRRRNGAGLAALIDELEAALIPVNRSAGRRALARLAREVKRVTSGSARSTRPERRELANEEAPTAAGSSRSRELVIADSPSNWSEMPTMEFEPNRRGPSPSQSDVDSLISQFGVGGEGEQQHARALRALAGIDPSPAVPPVVRVQPVAAPPEEDGRPTAHGPAAAFPSSPEDADLEALLALQDAPVPPKTASVPPPREGPKAPAPDHWQPKPSSVRDPASVTRPTPLERPAPARNRPRFDSSERPTDPRQMPTQPSQLKKARVSTPSPPLASSRSGAPLVLLALAAVAGGSYAVSRLRPMAPASHAAQPAEVTARALPPQESAKACVGTLVVTDVPPHAEVLLREGQAPVDIPRMPVGARLEFVATAEGFAPKRVVVPAGIAWDSGPDGRPRFEAAVQLDPSRAHAPSVDPWPAGEPGSEVGGQGSPGTVRVVAAPRGAEVWMLAGIGPDASIEQISCEKDLDVLLAGPTTYRKRLHVAGGDFVLEAAPPGTAAKADRRTARVSAK